MSKILRIFAAFVLFFHGLIHLMGTTVYLKLGSLDGFPYKTTILNGQVNLGENGIALFGGLWALATLGFVVAALGLLLRWKVSQPLLLGVTLFSLLLTGLDWEIAFAGAIINLVILALLLVVSITRTLAWRPKPAI
jgi:hypothetical protein